MESPHFREKSFTCVDIVAFQFPSIKKFIPKLTDHVGIKSGTIIEGFGSFMPIKDRITFSISPYQMNIFGRTSFNVSIGIVIKPAHCLNNFNDIYDKLPNNSDITFIDKNSFYTEVNKTASIDKTVSPEILNAHKNTKYYKPWIGKIVLVGYPHFRRAKVIAISTKYGIIQCELDRKGNASYKETVWTQSKLKKYIKKTRFIEKTCYNKGICFSNGLIFAHVKLETGMHVNDNQYVPKYSQLETLFPVEMVVPLDDVNTIVDPLHKPLNIADIPLQHLQPVIYIGPSPEVSRTWCGAQPMNKAQANVFTEDKTKWSTLRKKGLGDLLYGSLAYVQQSKPHYNISILVPTLHPFKVSKEVCSDITWLPLEKAAATLHMDKDLLYAICSTIPVTYDNSTIELGLCLLAPDNIARQNYCKSVVISNISSNPSKECTTGSLQFWRKEYSNTGSVLDYSKVSYRKSYGNKSLDASNKVHVEYSWYLSMNAINLIRRYMHDLKPLYDALKDSSSVEWVDLDMLLVGDWADLTVKDVVAKVCKWQEEHGVMNLPIINAVEECMDNDILLRHEADLKCYVSQLYGQINSEEMYRIVELKNVPREHLFVPSLKISEETVLSLNNNLKSQQPSLGARIIYIYDSGVVPMGARGVIVRIMDKYIEVVFDTTFSGGTLLGGRISTNRGAIIDISKVLIYSSEESYNIKQYNKSSASNLHARVQYYPTKDINPNSIFYNELQSLFGCTKPQDNTGSTDKMVMHNDSNTGSTDKMVMHNDSNTGSTAELNYNKGHQENPVISIDNLIRKGSKAKYSKENVNMAKNLIEKIQLTLQTNQVEDIYVIKPIHSPSVQTTGTEKKILISDKEIKELFDLYI